MMGVFMVCDVKTRLPGTRRWIAAASRWASRCVIALLALAGMAEVRAAQANISWTGTGGNTNWTTSTNWSPTTTLNLQNYAGAQYNMTFGVAAGGTSNNNIASGTVRSFIFSAAAGQFTITGSSVAFGNAAGILNSSTNTQTISLAGITLAATQSFDATSGDLIINSSLLGANGFDVTGRRVTLTGSSSNTGASTVTSGQLRITNSFALGGTTSGLTVADAAALELEGGITVGAEPITSLQGTGTGATSGALRNISGTNTWGGLITLANATRINSDAGLLRLDVASGNAISGVADNLTFGGAGNIEVNDPISNTTATLTKDGTGLLTLAASNTYSGATTISGGLLRATTSTNALGQGTLTLGGGNLELANDTGLNYGRNTTVSTSGTIFSERLTSGTGVTHTLGTLSIGAQTLTVATDATVTSGTAGLTFGNVAISGAATLKADAGTLLTTGTITGDFALAIGGDGNTTIAGFSPTTTTQTLTKTGNGRLTLSATSGYTGQTTISGGTLSYGIANALSTGSVTINGGAIDIASFSDSVGIVTLTSGNIVGTTGTLTSTANFATTSGTISATLGGTNFGIAQQGSGKTVVTSSNAFTGASTVASGGVLNVRNAFALGTTGTATVSSGGALELQNSGTLARVLSLSGSGISGGGALRNVSGTNGIAAGIAIGAATRINSDADLLTLSGTIVGTNQNLTFGGAGNITASNTIALGTGSLTKDGSGLLTLSGNNTYTGATAISSGTLSASRIVVSTGSSSLGNATSAVILGDGSNEGTLSYAGTSATYTRGFTVNAGGGQLDVTTAGQTLTIGGTGNVTGSGLFTVGGAGNVTVSSTIAGVSGLTMAGSGTLTLSATNTFGGTTTVNSGVLRFGVANVLSSSNAVNVTGGTFDIQNFSDTVASFAITGGSFIGSGTLTAGAYSLQGGTISANLGSGTITTAASTTLSATSAASVVQVNAGTLTLSTANLLSAAPVVTGSAGGTLALGGSQTVGSIAGGAGVSLGSNTLTTGGSNTSTTLSGDVTGSGNLVKVGSGTFTLSGNNAFSGTTSINAGAVSVGSVAAGAVNQALGTGNTVNLGVTGSSSGRLVYTGGTGELSKNVFALGNGSDTIQNAGSGLLTLSGTLRKDGTILRLQGGAQGITVTGRITGTSPNSDLAIQNGLTTLSTTNSYDGPTFINSSGTLALGISNAIPSNSAVTIGGTFAGGNGGAGTLQMNSFTNTIGSLAFAGSGGTLAMVPTLSATSTPVLSASGAVNLTGTSTLDLTGLVTSTSVGLYRLIGSSGLTGQFSGTTGLDGNYLVRYGTVNTNEVSLQRKADQAATFTMTTGTVTRALVGTTVAVSGSLTNSTPSGGSNLAVSLSSGGVLTVGSLTSGTNSIAPQASTTVTGSIQTGITAGTQSWSVINTDSNAITTTSTATGSLTVVNDRTFSTGTIAFGRFLNTTNPLSGTSSITSTGLSGTTANSTLGAFGTSNGLTLSLTGGTSAFTGLVTTQTATYTTSGGYTGALGSVSGAFSGTATNEFGGTSGVTVNYTGTSVAQRTFSTGTSTLALGFVHQGGSIGSPTVVVTSTGLNNVTANATLGSFSGGPAGFSLGLTGGSAEFLGSSGTQTATYTLAGSTAALGAISGTFSSAVSAEFGSIPNVAVAVTGNVYSGQSTWATNGGGNWGTFSGTGANAFGGNWGENQGSPGLDPSFANTDTATFGSALTGGTAAINTAGANISLKAVTFNNAAGSYELYQTGGSGPLALLAAGTNSAAINVLAGSHAIHAAVGLGSNAVVDVASGAALTFSNAISGSAFGLTKTGLGALTLTGTSTFTGPTSLDAGSLLVNGSLASDVIAAASTALGGSGSIAGVLSGAGLVSPGNSPGILTAGGFDPTGGLDAAFEFTQANPTYNSSTASGNDVLRLTNSSPFVATLGGGNVVDVYFNVDSLQYNQAFTGGFFTGQEAGELLAAVQSAQFNFWFKALSGPGVRTFDNVNYNPLTFAYSDFSGARVETSQVSANFASGTVTGSVTTFIVVPEPGSLALMGVGIALLAWRYRPRRSR